jgi:glycosyltransferase involved in cell wall biosynthesis
MYFPLMKYSICVTVYNSEEIANKFISDLLSSKVEIIIVDSMSTDQTYNILKQYSSDVVLIRKKSTRGTGKKIAIEHATGDFIILLDFDIKIYDINNIIEEYEKSNRMNKILAMKLKGSSCTPNVFVGPRSLFLRLDAWPDLNCFEDVYFEKIFNAFDLIEYKEITLRYDCLKIKNAGPGRESRYGNRIIKKIIRRLVCASDAIFVAHFNYKQLMEYYKICGYKKVYVGMPEYVIALILSKFIRIIIVDEKIMKLKNDGL